MIKITFIFIIFNFYLIKKYIFKDIILKVLSISLQYINSKNSTKKMTLIEITINRLNKKLIFNDSPILYLMHSTYDKCLEKIINVQKLLCHSSPIIKKKNFKIQCFNNNQIINGYYNKFNITTTNLKYKYQYDYISIKIKNELDIFDIFNKNYLPLFKSRVSKQTIIDYFKLNKNPPKILKKYLFSLIFSRNNFFYKQKDIITNNKCYISTPKISIICLIYNKEIFIRQLIKSIQNQSFKDIEILFVNDGSKDLTERILKSFLFFDNRIKIINNGKNKGNLYSRINGITHAKGKYLMLIDGDDLYINNLLFKKVYDIIENTGVDIVQYLVYHGSYSSLKRYNYVLKIPDKIYNRIELNRFEFIYHTPTLWNKIMKTSINKKAVETTKKLLGENFHLNNILIGSDGFYSLSLYNQTYSYLTVNIFGHLYLRNSLSKVRNKREKKYLYYIVKSNLKLMKMVYKLLKNEKDLKKKKQIILNYFKFITANNNGKGLMNKNLNDYFILANFFIKKKYLNFVYYIFKTFIVRNDRNNNLSTTKLELDSIEF